MNWNDIQGKTGRCKVYIDTFTRKDGTTGQSNKIKRFLEPAQQSAPATPSWKTGNKGGW